jgi:hypothetical protein
MYYFSIYLDELGQTEDKQYSPPKHWHNAPHRNPKGYNHVINNQNENMKT